MENFQELLNYDFSSIEPLTIDNSIDFQIPKMNFAENQNQHPPQMDAVSQPELFQMNNQWSMGFTSSISEPLLSVQQSAEMQLYNEIASISQQNDNNLRKFNVDSTEEHIPEEIFNDIIQLSQCMNTANSNLNQNQPDANEILLDISQSVPLLNHHRQNDMNTAYSDSNPLNQMNDNHQLVLPSTNQSNDSISAGKLRKKSSKHNIPKPVYLDFNYTSEMPSSLIPKKSKRKSKSPKMVVNNIESVKIENNSQTVAPDLSNLSIEEYSSPVNEAKIIDEPPQPLEDNSQPMTIETSAIDQNLSTNESPTSFPSPADNQIVHLRTLVNQFVKLENSDELFLVAKPMRKEPLTILEELKRIDEIEWNVPMIDVAKQQRERKQILTPKAIRDNDIHFEEINIAASSITSLKSDDKKPDFKSPKSMCVRSLFKDASPTINEIDPMPKPIIEQEKNLDKIIIEEPQPKKVSSFINVAKKINYVNDDDDMEDSSADEYYFEPNKSLKCKKCAKIFITPRSLVKHEKLCDFVVVIESKKKIEISASIENAAETEMSIKSESLSDKYCCTVCDRKFSKLNGFISHKKTHTREKQGINSKLNPVDSNNKLPKRLNPEHRLRSSHADEKLSATGRRYPKRKFTGKTN